MSGDRPKSRRLSQALVSVRNRVSQSVCADEMRCEPSEPVADQRSTTKRKIGQQTTAEQPDFPARYAAVPVPNRLMDGTAASTSCITPTCSCLTMRPDDITFFRAHGRLNIAGGRRRACLVRAKSRHAPSRSFLHHKGLHQPMRRLIRPLAQIRVR
jgi:hypothetical protein